MISKFAKTTKIFSVILNGKIYGLDEESRIDSVENLFEYVKKTGKLILKPYIYSDGGRGVLLLESDESGSISLNGSKITVNELSNVVCKMKRYIVCEYIVQSEYGKKLYSETVNTIRIVTMIDPKTKQPFIATAVQRIGTLQSNPVDNWSSGGLSALIDLETGVLGKAVRYPNSERLEWHQTHPDTGDPIEGIRVPNWGDIKDKILRISSKFPYLEYVGWDIVPFDDDILIIEANNCTDVNLLQVHRPLLRNEMITNFYKYYKII